MNESHPLVVLPPINLSSLFCAYAKNDVFFFKKGPLGSVPFCLFFYLAGCRDFFFAFFVVIIIT